MCNFEVLVTESSEILGRDAKQFVLDALGFEDIEDIDVVSKLEFIDQFAETREMILTKAEVESDKEI